MVLLIHRDLHDDQRRRRYSTVEFGCFGFQSDSISRMFETNRFLQPLLQLLQVCKWWRERERSLGQVSPKPTEKNSCLVIELDTYEYLGKVVHSKAAENLEDLILIAVRLCSSSRSGYAMNLSDTALIQIPSASHSGQ